jgi:hypothetical protein
MKPGQQVVCIRNGKWNLVLGPWTGNEIKPTFNEVLTIRQVVGLFLTFDEYPPNEGYGAKNFAPLMSDEELEEALKGEVVTN